MAKTLFIIKKIELIGKLGFIVVILDKNAKIFVVYIAALKIMLIHSIWDTQIV